MPLKRYRTDEVNKQLNELDQKQYILDNYQTGSLLVVHMYCLTLVTFFFSRFWKIVEKFLLYRMFVNK